MLLADSSWVSQFRGIALIVLAHCPLLDFVLRASCVRSQFIAHLCSLLFAVRSAQNRPPYLPLDPLRVPLHMPPQFDTAPDKDTIAKFVSSLSLFIRMLCGACS